MTGLVVRWAAVVAILVAGLGAVAPAEAASKTVTVQVSCSIPERLEISNARSSALTPSSSAAIGPNFASNGWGSMEMARSGSLMTVRSTLVGRYDISESFMLSAAGAMKLFTVTAI